MEWHFAGIWSDRFLPYVKGRITAKFGSNGRRVKIGLQDITCRIANATRHGKGAKVVQPKKSGWRHRIECHHRSPWDRVRHFSAFPLVWFSQHFNRRPFSLALAPVRLWRRDPCTILPQPGERKSVLREGRNERYALYLKPAGLRLWFLLFAFPLVGLLWFAYGIWALCVPAFMYLGYYILYGLLNLPVLSRFWEDLPSPLEPWILSWVQSIDLYRKDRSRILRSPAPLDRRLRAGMYVSWGRSGPVYKRVRPRPFLQPINILRGPGPQQPASHQELLVRLAMIDRFSDRGNSKDVMPLLWFFSIWCTPVWLAFLALLTLSLLVAFFHGVASDLFSPFLPASLYAAFFPGNTPNHVRTLPALLYWAMLSILFFSQQLRFLGKNWSCSDANLDLLPAGLIGHFKVLTTFPTLVRGVTFQSMAALIFSLAVGIYIALLNILPDPAPTHAPQPEIASAHHPIPLQAHSNVQHTE